MARLPLLSKTLGKHLAVLKNTPGALRIIWGAHRFGAILLPILILATGPLQATYLYCIKKVIDGVSLSLQGQVIAGQDMIVCFLAFGFALLIFQEILRQSTAFVQQLLNKRLSQHVQQRIAEKAITLDLAYFETASYYDNLRRAQEESFFRAYGILSSLTHGGRDIVRFSSFCVLLGALSWWSVPYALLAALPGLLVQVFFGRLNWVIMYGRTPEERKMRYYESVLTSNTEAKEVRLFGLSDYFLSRWVKTFRKFYRQDRRLAARRNAWELGASSVQVLAILGFYAFAIHQTITHPLLTVGSLVMFVQAMEQSMGAISNIFTSTATLYENGLYLGNLFQFFSQQPRVCAPPRPRPVPRPIHRSLVFESVHFGYPNAVENALQGISFEIRAGEKVALVGENGAGKTTIVKLLARLYDPSHGRICVDGIDLRDIDPTQWRKEIAVIFQDYCRYAMTARENIGFGQLDRVDDLARIRAAAQVTGIASRIEGFPNGWDTILGKFYENGQELSGGEWQKVALARCFVREAQILILDEPTASLDAKQEYETFARFSELTQGKTTMLISHRFSTVRMADRILVVEKGAIRESGSHEELISMGGRYAELFNRQASGYL